LVKDCAFPISNHLYQGIKYPQGTRTRMVQICILGKRIFSSPRAAQGAAQGKKSNTILIHVPRLSFMVMIPERAADHSAAQDLLVFLQHEHLAWSHTMFGPR